MKFHQIAILLSSFAVVPISTVPAGGRGDQMVLKKESNGNQPAFTGSVNPQSYQPGSLRLLSTSENEAVWANPDELIEKGKKFFDITDHAALGEKAEQIQEDHLAFPLPKAIRYEALVKPLLDEIDQERLRERLTKFTSFHNRYYRSPTGVQSAEWLESQLQEMAGLSESRITIRRFNHAWDQFSLIARFEPVTSSKNPKSTEEPMVIIGSHQDTTRGSLFGDGRAPGADDDGSGSMTTLEAFTILCEAGFHPSRPVEFHWYSAEEVGLRGSQDVAAAYQRDAKKVMGMLHFDMTGYSKSDVYGIVNDYTDPGLTSFLKMLGKNYGGLPMVDTKCNYACSDHASWNRAGYRSAFPFEGEFKDSSPYIHGKQDTVENIDFDHMGQFVKLAIGFAVELGEPKVPESHVSEIEDLFEDFTQKFVDLMVATGAAMGEEDLSDETIELLMDMDFDE